MTSAAPATNGRYGVGPPRVEMLGVNKWFGDLHVLTDIDLTITRGEVVVVIGPSGSGRPRCAVASIAWSRSRRSDRHRGQDVARR